MIDFANDCQQLQQHMENAYGIRVITRDIPYPLTGDLNGAEIHVDEAVTPEQRLFLLAHLFGHTVQWNTTEGAYELGQPQQPPVDEALLPSLMEYERQAARFAQALLHEIGITAADQWFADYAACDAAYLRHFYVTGEKREFLSFWQEGAPLVEPQLIPRFTPSMRAFRSDGIVI
jgi:hypothetical protein